LPNWPALVAVAEPRSFARRRQSRITPIAKLK
jgi:hypothetical protein